MAFANRSSSFALEDRSTESEPAGTFRSLPERRVESLGCVPCARSTPTLLMFTRSILILESLPPSGTYRQGFIKTLLQNAHAGRFDRRHKINRALSIIRRYPKPDGPAVNRSCNRSAKGAIQRVGRTLNGRKSARSSSTSRVSTVCGMPATTARSTFAPFGIRPTVGRLTVTPVLAAGGEATHNKSALGEGINVSVWAN